jgi:uncharacterized membrane protein YhdT
MNSTMTSRLGKTFAFLLKVDYVSTWVALAYEPSNASNFILPEGSKRL